MSEPKTDKAARKRKPQVITRRRSKDDFHGVCRNYSLLINRRTDRLTELRTYDWYILVIGPDGGYCYDGWWKDSSDKTLDEAIQEAIKGSGIV